MTFRTELDMYTLSVKFLEDNHNLKGKLVKFTFPGEQPSSPTELSEEWSSGFNELYSLWAMSNQISAIHIRLKHFLQTTISLKFLRQKSVLLDKLSFLLINKIKMKGHKMKKNGDYVPNL